MMRHHAVLLLLALSPLLLLLVHYPPTWTGYSGGTCRWLLCVTPPNPTQPRPFLEISLNEYDTPEPTVVPATTTAIAATSTALAVEGATMTAPQPTGFYEP